MSCGQTCPGVTCPPMVVRANCCPPPPCGGDGGFGCEPCCSSPPCCPKPGPTGNPPCLGGGQGALIHCDPVSVLEKRRAKEIRWPQCNFLRPCIDTRIYRNGEAMCISYAGHIPGEQFIHGRNLPTTTTFAKKRLCQYTPYEFIDPDGCCTFCTYP